MGTHAALFIQTDDSTDWLQVFCHFDGYPSHMMPALTKADPAALIAAGAIRGLNEDGSLEPTRGQPKAAERVEAPTLPSWADHAYILTAAGWKHAPTAREARRIAEC